MRTYCGEERAPGVIARSSHVSQGWFNILWVDCDRSFRVSTDSFCPNEILEHIKGRGQIHLEGINVVALKSPVSLRYSLTFIAKSGQEYIWCYNII